MQNLFEHTVQPLGLTTSPVEDLALEVTDAFEKIQSIVATDPYMIKTFKDAIGSPMFVSLKQHAINKTITESHNILDTESTIVLENVPDKDSISVYYISTLTGDIVNLVGVGNNNDFTAKDQFKAEGKLLKLNVNIPESKSTVFTVTYHTTTFSLNNKKILPNVIKDSDNSWTYTPENLTSDSFQIILKSNLSNRLDEFKSDLNKDILFFKSTNLNDWLPIEVNSYTIVENTVTINTETIVDPNSKVVMFINNTSISELLDSLYKEFIEHDHSSSNVTKNIDVKDIVNRVVNKNNISYTSDHVPNYSFPQYFNREGYNPNIDSVYENSILGDVFISRLLSNDGTKYKGLDTDSNKLIFGDPELGHYFKYNRQADALDLSSNNLSNGLNIKTIDQAKYGLRLNNSKLASLTTSLKIMPENNIVEIIANKPTDKTLLVVDNFNSSGTSTLNSAVIKDFTINKVKFTENTDKVALDVVQADPLNSTGVLNINVPTNIKEANIKDLKITGTVRQANADIDSLVLGHVDYHKNDTSDVDVTSSVPEAYVKYNVDLKSKKFYSDSMTVGTIHLDKNSDPLNKGLIVWSSDPSSDVNITAKTTIKNLSTEVLNTEDILALEGNIDSLKSSEIAVGGINFKKDKDDNLTINSGISDKKVIINSPVEFKNITTGLDSKVTLTTVTSEVLNIGNHSISKDNVNTLLSPLSPDAVFNINSKTKISDATLDKVLIKSGDVESLSIGGNKLESKDGVATLSGNSTLAIQSKVEMSSAHIEDLSADNLYSLKSDIDELSIGGITFKENSNKDLIIQSNTPAKIIDIKSPVTVNEISIKKSTIVESILINTEATSIKLGGIILQKELGSTNAKIGRNDTESILKITTPTEISELSLEALNVTETTNLNKVNFKELKFNNYIFKEENGALTLSEKDNKIFTIKSPLIITKGVATNFSSNFYTLYNGDKLGVDSENYISNEDGKLTFNHKKAFNLIGSGKTSGVNFSLSKENLPSVKQYISSNSGVGGVETEKNMFIETDLTSGTYFLKPVNQKVNYNGVVFGFNDSTAEKNISDLTKWFRSDIFVGKIESSSLTALPSEKGKKNGIAIGDTRISVIGADSSCPSGLTVIESQEGIHLVKPISGNDTSCTNLTYQEVSTGSLLVKGDLSVDGSSTVTEDLLVSGTLACSNIVSNEDAELNNILVSGNAEILGTTIFGSDVTFKNEITLSNDLKANSKIMAKSLEISLNSRFGKSLEIGDSLDVASDVAIGGGLAVKDSITSDSIIKSESVNTGRLATQELTVNGNTSLVGTATVQGKLVSQNGLIVSGNIDSNNSLTVRESLTTNTLFTIKDATVRGKFTAMDSADIYGNNITLGTEDTLVQVNGKIQFNTKNDIVFNSPVRIYNSLKIIENAEIVGLLKNSGGVEIGSFLNVNGKVVVESDSIFESSVTMKSAVISSNLEVDNSVIANNITSESIVVSSAATVANLSITKSLAMAIDTTLSGGASRFTSLNLTDSEAINNISGDLTVAKDANLIRNVFVGQKAIFGTDGTVIDSDKVDVKDGTLVGKSVKTSEILGLGTLQAPPSLLVSKNPVVNQIGNSVAGRQFVKIENFVSDGICLFNSPVIMDTLIFKDLIYMGDSSDASSGLLGLDIIARKAVYG